MNTALARSICSVGLMAALATFAPSFSHADDASVEAGLSKVASLYAGRETLSNAQEAAKLADSLRGQAQDEEVQYKVLIASSKAYYWIGGHVADKDAKLKAFDTAKERGLEATRIIDDYADGYYYASIALGKWGLTNGIFNSLRQSGDLESLAKKVQSRETMEGQPGNSIDGNGPDRTLGRMYFKLPAINPFGPTGDRSKALFHLERAVKETENNTNARVALNSIYLAEVLADGNASEKARAKQILTALIQQIEKDPAAYNPAKTPETKDELREAKELLSSI
jgi:hypothetical protein